LTENAHFITIYNVPWHLNLFNPERAKMAEIGLHKELRKI